MVILYLIPRSNTRCRQGSISPAPPHSRVHRSTLLSINCRAFVLRLRSAFIFGLIIDPWPCRDGDCPMSTVLTSRSPCSCSCRSAADNTGSGVSHVVTTMRAQTLKLRTYACGIVNYHRELCCYMQRSEGPH